MNIETKIAIETLIILWMIIIETVRVIL